MKTSAEATRKTFHLSIPKYRNARESSKLPNTLCKRVSVFRYSSLAGFHPNLSDDAIRRYLDRSEKSRHHFGLGDFPLRNIRFEMAYNPYNTERDKSLR